MKMDQELACAVTNFEKIYKSLTISFYLVGMIEIVTSTSAILLHSLEETVPSVTYPSLALEGVAIVFAAILVFIPLDSARKSCALARSSCSKFLRNAGKIPPAVYEQITSANTLWFTHPMSKCSLLNKKNNHRVTEV
jgi:hypothetical protein